jgi:hypothetical protein
METVYREIEGMRKELEATGETGEIMRKMCLQIMDQVRTSCSRLIHFSEPHATHFSIIRHHLQVERAFKLNREGTGGNGGGGFVTIEEF